MVGHKHRPSYGARALRVDKNHVVRLERQSAGHYDMVLLTFWSFAGLCRVAGPVIIVIAVEDDIGTARIEGHGGPAACGMPFETTVTGLLNRLSWDNMSSPKQIWLYDTCHPQLYARSVSTVLEC